MRWAVLIERQRYMKYTAFLEERDHLGDKCEVFSIKEAI
jgi:hypothetical protein